MITRLSLWYTLVEYYLQWYEGDDHTNGNKCIHTNVEVQDSGSC